MPTSPSPADEAFHAAALPDLRVIRAVGADAIAFLQAQLTQDVNALAAGGARLGAYCTAKGRVLATLVIWQDTAASEPCVLAIVSTDVVEPLLKRLRMYVLRAKVALEPTELTVTGVWADSAGAVAGLERAVGTSLPVEPWARADDAENAVWIAAPRAVGAAARWWRIALPEAAMPPAAVADAGSWLAQDAAAGLTWVGLAGQELFTPQMANLDLLGGVSFDKGCYPGQEVVARSHYLGKQKRRTLLGEASADAVPAPGTDVFDAARGDQPVGRVVSAAPLPSGVRVLFEAPFAGAEAAELRLGASDGPALRLVELPYALEAAR